MEKLTPSTLREKLSQPEKCPDVRAFDSAFTLLSGEFDSGLNEEVRIIPTNCVLSHNWEPTRYQSVLDALDSGVELPPIVVSGHRWQGETFYTLTDGNHRAEGHKTRKLTHIRAVVTDLTDCVPELYYVEGRTLYKNGAAKTTHLSRTSIVALRKLGVRWHWNPWRWSVDIVSLIRHNRTIAVTPEELMDFSNFGPSEIGVIDGEQERDISPASSNVGGPKPDQVKK